MAKYGDWTLGETEAIINIIGGIDIARAVLRGERKLIVEAVAVQKSEPPSKPALVGTLVKTLVLKPYKAKSVADAIKLGKYDGVDHGIAELFAEDGVGLGEETRIDLYQFNRDPEYSEEVLEWAKDNGNKKPILPPHIYGIGIQHPEDQRRNPIVELGSVRSGEVLCLYGGSGWRSLDRGSFRLGWGRFYLFGFLGE